MKKVVNLAILAFSVFSLFLASGCSELMPEEQSEAMKSYPKDTAPSQVIKTADKWVMLHSAYAGTDYVMSVGNDLDSASEFYSVQGVSIWYFESDGNLVAWCEKSEDFYTYKVYDFATQKVETLHQASVENGFQPQNVGVFRNTVYYCSIDYDKKQVSVMGYDVASQTASVIDAVELVEERQPYSINVEDKYLSLISSCQVKVLDLVTQNIAFDSELPSSITCVYGASYDEVNDTCALYYADSDSEDIGFLKEGDKDIASVFTFNENHYAYQDKLECNDGHIYWIAQANISGNVSDHYSLVDYNYLEHSAVETKRTFGFCRDGADLYALRFNKDGDYTHIDLCKVK